MAVAGNVIVQFWRYDDAAGDPKTGMVDVTDMTITLHRQSGSTMVAATETVTVTEVGVTGYYYISFTPDNAGLYVLELEEINADSMLRHPRWDFEVATAGTVFVPSLANAFCSEADIERWLQQAISSTTAPTDTEAAAFAESRAAVLQSLCASLGYSVTPSTVTSGSRLQDLLREANAIGAALDYLGAQTYRVKPSDSPKILFLAAMWDRYFGSPTNRNEPRGYIALEIKGNLASLATDHIISGDTVAYTEGAAPTSLPIGITMGTSF